MKKLLELLALLRPWPNAARDSRKADAGERTDPKAVRVFAGAELNEKGAGLNPPSHLIFG